MAIINTARMKHLMVYLLGLVLLGTACNKQDYSLSPKTQVAGSSFKTVSYWLEGLKYTLKLTDENIIGEWGLCVTKTDEITLMMFECSVFEFKKDKTANITYPSGEKLLMNWAISNGQVVIHRIEDESKANIQAYPDTVYHATLIKNGADLNLELKTNTNDILYLDRRLLN